MFVFTNDDNGDDEPDDGHTYIMMMIMMVARMRFKMWMNCPNFYIFFVSYERYICVSL